jgi:hypothetical protein
MLSTKPVIYFDNLSNFPKLKHHLRQVHHQKKNPESQVAAIEPKTIKIGNFEYLTKPKGLEKDMIKDLIFNHYKS